MEPDQTTNVFKIKVDDTYLTDLVDTHFESCAYLASLTRSKKDNITNYFHTLNNKPERVSKEYAGALILQQLLRIKAGANMIGYDKND